MRKRNSFPTIQETVLFSMKRAIILIGIIGSFYSCSNNKSPKVDKMFSFNKKDTKTFKLEDLQQIVKSFKLLDLQNNIAPLLKIKKIYFDTKQLYITEPTGKLYVYNKKTGKQQFIIDKKGRGANEYLIITDIVLQGNEIHIYDNKRKQILKFKKSDGTFIGSKTIDIYANGGVIKYNNSIFFSFNLGDHLITKTDTNYHIQQKYLKRVFFNSELAVNTLFKSDKGLFYLFPFSDSLYHYSDSKFQLYKVIRNKRSTSKVGTEKQLKKSIPYYNGSFILECFVSNNLEMASIFPAGLLYLKKNNTITTYNFKSSYKPFINRCIVNFTRSADGNTLYAYENDASKIKEAVTKNIATYKKLSNDNNCPYADFYKSLLNKLPEINEDSSPLVFIAEINK